MHRYILLLFLAAIVHAVHALVGDNADNSIHRAVYGDCTNTKNSRRVLFSKTCINEYDNRNYTLGWSGKEEITCIDIEAKDGIVHAVAGGVGQYSVVIYVESITGKELVWDAEIFVKES